MRLILTFLLILLLFTLALNPAIASEEKMEKAHAEEEKKIPVLYYLQWAILILIFTFSLFFAYKVKQISRLYDRKELAYILTFLALLAYSLNYHPQIKEYHELPWIGSMKFLLTVADGALLTYYGVLGRHEEYEEVGER
jgi:hypothetical protein